MPWTDEERKSYMKAYREANKDKHKKNWAEWQKKNKQYNITRQREYRKTTEGHKNYNINNWKAKGVIGDYDQLYEYYMNCDKCEVCNKEFTEKIKKCLDHDHNTGDFRFILCASCNDHDYWKKKINHTDN